MTNTTCCGGQSSDMEHLFGSLPAGQVAWRRRGCRQMRGNRESGERVQNGRRKADRCAAAVVRVGAGARTGHGGPAPELLVLGHRLSRPHPGRACGGGAGCDEGRRRSDRGCPDHNHGGGAEGDRGRRVATDNSSYSTLYTLARPMPKAFAISVAPRP
jgi:hypothetical protein